MTSRFAPVTIVQVSPNDPLWQEHFSKEPVACAVATGGNLSHRAMAAFFVALPKDTSTPMGSAQDAGKTGHVAAFIDTNAPALSLGGGQTVERYGSFGLLQWNGEDLSELHALLQAAQQWLKQQGVHFVVGPMNFSIFHGYRVFSSGFERHPFLGETQRQPGLREALEQCGLSTLSTWRTYDYTAADHLNEVEAVAGKMATYAGKLAQYKVEHIDCSTPSGRHREMRMLYPLIMESFSKNFATTNLDFECFQSLYNPMASLICSASSIRIMHQDACVGFTISIINPLEAGTVIWHSFGNTAAHRGQGLGYLCIDATFRGFVAKGYRASLCGPVKDGANHFEHTHAAARCYHIMGRALR
jgi:hypothetical protein